MTSFLTRLAVFASRRRKLVIGAWIALTVLGVAMSGDLSSRWDQTTSVPGKPAYEAGQRALHDFGAGVRSPNVVVFHTAFVA